MTETRFEALVIRTTDTGQQAAIEELSPTDLPEGEVEVNVEFSSLNYKDGLAVTGTGKVIRSFPMVPGIDLAGTVVTSNDPTISPGTQVLATGWGLGEQAWGGYGQRARLRAEHLLPLPAGTDPRWAMSIGTAGLTAMLCVTALEDAGLRPSAKPVLVTGAAGGVGSLAVALLSRLGFEVAAVTGREDAAPYLRELGAIEIVSRQAAGERSRPLAKQRWIGAVDVVGGDILARVLAETCYGGAVAACGLAGSAKLQTTVMPFILRGVRLLGVDSVMCPNDRRRAAWDRLAELLPASALEPMVREEPLARVPELAQEILKGRIRGRVVINVR